MGVINVVDGCRLYRLRYCPRAHVDADPSVAYAVAIAERAGDATDRGSPEGHFVLKGFY